MSKKVLFITSTFPRSEKEVLAKWIGELAVRLKRKGLSISVFAPAFRGSHSHKYFGIQVNRFRYAPRIFEFITQDEGAIVKIRRNPLTLFIVPLYLFFGCIAIILHVRKFKYDIIHVNWPFPNGIFGVLAKKILKSRLILTFYGAELVLAKHVPAGEFILRKIIGQGDTIIAISTYTKSMIQKILEVPINIVPFAAGITLDFREDLEKDDNLGNGKKRILFAGRLVERKGVKYLIAAMPKILELFDVVLDVVGEGPIHSELEQQIKSLNLAKKVVLRGKVPDKTLKTLYKKCDIFVLPAITDKWGETEGLGVVILEAMSFKKPVVASRIGGIVDIIEDGKTGILVPEKDKESLSLAIIKILKNEELAKKFGENGFRVLASKFSWGKIIDQTLKIYYGQD